MPDSTTRKASDDNYQRTLNLLPPELIDRVAFFLPEDRDICNFQKVCQRTYAAISHPRSNIWTQRFSEIFDVPAFMRGNAVDFQFEYMSRQMSRRILQTRRSRVFGGVNASKTNEGPIIELVRELIHDSFAVVPSHSSSHTDGRVSKNIKHLAEISANTLFMNNCMRSASNKELSFPQLQLYRLILTHLALNEHNEVSYCFEYSQQAVYGHPLSFPLFKDESTKRELDLDNLLHIVNFFKYHIHDPNEYSLYDPFHGLPDDEKPMAWDSPVKVGLQKLGTHWKGCSAYLYDGPRMSCHLRRNAPGYYSKRVVAETQHYINYKRPFSNHIYSDVMTAEGCGDGFVSLHLDFTRPTLPWPATFEKHLRPLPNVRSVTPDEASKHTDDGSKHQPTTHQETTVPEAKASGNFHQFQGFGRDDWPYSCAGTVTALPAQNPQNVYSIDGFQRVTMMKWANEIPANRTFPPGVSTAVEKHLYMMQNKDLKDIEDVEHWAYEGVVLPGGKIMLGRWWCPRETPEAELTEAVGPRVPRQGQRKCTGPFLFWNIDAAESSAVCEHC
ncbi:hypothetical protein MMC11_007641 [Xylographa trunciseda]|nr:hypothetical protein [Xylographa trunciseda]